MDSEGLVFLTDDGEINHNVTSPIFRKDKTYLVQVEGNPSENQLNELRGGVYLKGIKTLPTKVELLKEEPDLWARLKSVRSRKTVPTSWIKMSICEGKNHQVKRITASVGLPCLRLVRTKIGPIDLGDLKPGEYKIIDKPRL